MLYSAILFCLLAGPAAAQQDTGQQVLTPEMRQAEYNRLSEEIQVLAGRNAWTGVERFYGQLVQTGIPLQFDELLTGAHAARALGNAAEMRRRLAAASKLREAREVIDWLWEIDAAYGRVFLACDAGRKQQPALSVTTRPFDPNQARAVDFAIAQVAANCHFDGLLPKGEYRFGEHLFEVKPRVESIGIDLRVSGDPTVLPTSDKPGRASKKK